MQSMLNHVHIKFLGTWVQNELLKSFLHIQAPRMCIQVLLTTEWWPEQGCMV